MELVPVEDKRGEWFVCLGCGRELHQIACGELRDELEKIAEENGPVGALAKICLGED